MGWIASWAVLMNYRVSTQGRGRDWKKGVSYAGSQLVEQLRAFRAVPLAGAAGEEKTCWWHSKEVLISLGSMLTFKSYQLSSKLQLHFRCICSTFPNCFSSSKVCNLILSSVCIGLYQLLFSSWLHVSKFPFQVAYVIAPLQIKQTGNSLIISCPSG